MKNSLNGIVFIRNSDIRYDTRLRKAITEAVECGVKPYSLGWIRYGDNYIEDTIEISGNNIKTDFFFLQTKFGVGIKNIFKLAAFNMWIIKKIIVNRKLFNTIYICDFDVFFPAVVMKVFFGKKIIYDIFDFYSHTHSMPKILKYVIEKMEYRFCRYSNKVIVCTEKRAEILKYNTGIEPIIIYNTPKLNLILKKKIQSTICGAGEVFSIVYVGTLSATSRLLFEITEKIKNYTDIQLHVAGLGPLENYFKITAKEFENIFFYGQISNEEALSLQSSSDILFATYDPSLEINRNSAPNKVYESMALGKPIIVCTDTDADIIITKAECGIAIKYDVNEFMEAILRYKKNKDLKIKHGLNGLNLYEKKYNWSICQKKLKLLYKSI